MFNRHPPVFFYLIRRIIFYNFLSHFLVLTITTIMITIMITILITIMITILITIIGKKHENRCIKQRQMPAAPMQ